MTRIIMVTFSIVLAACGANDPVRICVPGESRACTCSSGLSGAQLCNAEGSALEACVCDHDAAVPVDAGESQDAAVAELDAGIDADVADAGQRCLTSDECGDDQTCRRVPPEYGVCVAVCYEDGAVTEIPLRLQPCAASSPECPDGMQCYTSAGSERLCGTPRSSTPPEPPLCNSDAQCDDGVFCNGSEACQPAATGADPVTGCRPNALAACTAGQRCVEDGRRCVVQAEVPCDD